MFSCFYNYLISFSRFISYLYFWEYYFQQAFHDEFSLLLICIWIKNELSLLLHRHEKNVFFILVFHYGKFRSKFWEQVENNLMKKDFFLQKNYDWTTDTEKIFTALQTLFFFLINFNCFFFLFFFFFFFFKKVFLFIWVFLKLFFNIFSPMYPKIISKNGQRY